MIKIKIDNTIELIELINSNIFIICVTFNILKINSFQANKNLKYHFNIAFAIYTHTATGIDKFAFSSVHKRQITIKKIWLNWQVCCEWHNHSPLRIEERSKQTNFSFLEKNFFGFSTYFCYLSSYLNLFYTFSSKLWPGLNLNSCFLRIHQTLVMITSL